MAALLSVQPAGADLRDFTGTLEVTQHSASLPIPPLAVSGSGVGDSGVAPSRAIRSFQSVTGFTGTSTLMFPTGTFSSGTGSLMFQGIGEPDIEASSAMSIVRGPMPVVGQFATRTAGGSRTISLDFGGGIGLGQGGTVSSPFLAFSLRFATWVAATVFESGVETPSGATGTVTAMGYDARTPSGMGTVQLVTPTRVSSGATDRIFISKLTLHFAPEPRGGLLLLAGSLVTLLLARRRSR